MIMQVPPEHRIFVERTLPPGLRGMTAAGPSSSSSIRAPVEGPDFFLPENKILPYDAAELTILFLAASQLAMVLLK